MKPLTIGKVAERSGVGIETVRFYEREGLLEKPTRSASGYRQFDEDVIRRLEFISRAKELGFTLNEIKELLRMRVSPDVCCDDVKARVDAKITDIETKIATLRRMKRVLDRLSSACGQKQPTEDCPILDALEGQRPIRKR